MSPLCQALCWMLRCTVVVMVRTDCPKAGVEAREQEEVIVGRQAPWAK